MRDVTIIFNQWLSNCRTTHLQSGFIPIYLQILLQEKKKEKEKREEIIL